MRLRVRLIAPIATLAMGMGCASVKMESITQRGYSKKVDRVYIVLSTSAGGSWSLLRNLKPELTSRLEAHKVQVQVHVKDVLALNESNLVKEEILSFKPHFILEMTQTSRTRSHGVDSAEGYDLALYEVGQDTPVWKALLQNGASGPAMAPNVNGPSGAGRVAGEMLRCLQKDGLL